MPPPTPFRSRLLGLALALAAGGVGHLAFPSFDVWPAAIASIGLLWGALTHLGAVASFAAVFLYAMALYAPMFWWARVAAGTVPWAFLTVATALLVAIVGPAWSFARRLRPLAASPAAAAFAFAAIWTAVEELRAVFPVGGFPWGRLAFSQSGSPMLRLAWLGGAPLTSFGVALAGALAAALVRYAVSGRTWAACGAALGVVVLVVGPLTVPLDGRAQAGSLRVAAVQGGGEADPLPDGVSRVRAVFDLHADLSEQLARNLGGDALDLVVWPEDSSGFDLADRPDVAAEIGSLAARVGAPILVGASEYPEAGGRYNVALLIDTDGRILQRYAKRHPVPFGEYIPWRSLARRVTSAVDRVSQDMLAGDEVGVIDLPVPRTGQQVPLGEVICFEVVHDSLVAEAVLAGAQILVVQTNNASFGNSTESAQQLAMSKLRAVEHGRAVVHISTTGESALISPAGIVLESAAAYTPATLVATMPLRTSLTPAAHWGQRLSWAFAALGAALGAIGVATAMTRARRKD